MLRERAHARAPLALTGAWVVLQHDKYIWDMHLLADRVVTCGGDGLLKVLDRTEMRGTFAAASTGNTSTAWNCALVGNLAAVGRTGELVVHDVRVKEATPACRVDTKSGEVHRVQLRGNLLLYSCGTDVCVGDMRKHVTEQSDARVLHTASSRVRACVRAACVRARRALTGAARRQIWHMDFGRRVVATCDFSHNIWLHRVQ